MPPHLSGSSLRRVLQAACALVLLLPRTSAAQGVTSGAIGGVITDQGGRPLENAQVQVVNRATGFTTGAQTRANGRYFVQNLEVGRTYTVRVRLIGYQAVERSNLVVTLGQVTRVDVALETAAAQLSAVTVQAERADALFSPTKQGVASVVTDTLIRRLPNLNRDLTDFVKLTPQAATPTTGGPSGGGAWNRLNNFTIDGANQNDRFNLNSTGGTPGGNAGGRQVSVEAVKEVQVVLAPTDVRQGNFAGMLINAVTKNGTNTLTGGATYTFRDRSLARDEQFVRDANLRVQNTSFSLGGPIIKDRLHFFIAPEFQTRTNPATGPALQQGRNFITDASTGVIRGVAVDSINRIIAAVRPRFDPGTAGSEIIDNPLRNWFGRLDFQLNSANRLVLRQLQNTATLDAFFRTLDQPNAQLQNQSTGIRLTSNQFKRNNRNNSSVLQLFTNLPNGMSNEFSAGFNQLRDFRTLGVSAPEVTVPVTRCDVVAADGNSCTTWGNTPVAVTFGGERFSPGNDLVQDVLELTNNFTMAAGNHTFTFGGRYENVRVYNNFAPATFGAYRFASIAALEAGTAQAYSVGFDNGAGIAARFRTFGYSLYAQDQWAASPDITFTYGIRGDLFQFNERPAFNRFVTPSIPGFANDGLPRNRINWSPRVGLNWNLSRSTPTQLRFSAGLFTGPPPYIVLSNAYSNTGLNLAQLDCLPGGPIPAFVTDVGNLPTACSATAARPVVGRAGTNVINGTSNTFRFPQYGVISGGFDRTLPGGITLTIEGTFREAVQGVLVRQANFRGPRIVNGGQYTDRYGRVLYADTITQTATGIAITNVNQRYLLNTTTLRTDSTTTNVPFTNGALEVTNQQGDRSYTGSVQARKRFGSWLDLTTAYTYMQARDVQSITSDVAISIWQNGRQLSGSHDDLTPTISYFQRPHRMLVFGTVTLPWKVAPTDLSFYYEGMSGTPLTYTTNGDLNGDLFNGNDPIYVPRNAADASEFRLGSCATATTCNTAFTLDPAMAAAFERFIERQPCLDRQRGSIMARNSCRSPWQNRMDMSVRQTLPAIAGQRFTAQLDIFNFLNFLNKDWGKIRFPVLSQQFPSQQVLIARGVTPGSLATNQVNFEFASDVRNNGGTNNADPFRVPPNQLNQIWQMQVTVRWAF